ncbi:MAG: DUF4013 domain-containing protein [Planctomycetes bacterium]|nr:DUF4013 domain-containing protein [Planctomycetota bacterium]
MHEIANVTLRKAMESRLQRLGVSGNRKVKMHVRGPSRVPAASDAGPAAHADDEALPGKTNEHLSDALQYLLLQRMPLLALVTTLSFPLLVGLGGFLTAGGSFLLLAGIAALPGLLVLSLVGAMGRRILRSSFEGSNDVPAIGDLGRLFDDAQRFVVDAAVVLGSFIAPPVLALLLGAPLSTSLPGLVVGGLFAPMAWALRNLRGDFQSLSPVLLMRAVARQPVQYLALAMVCWGLFGPAALTTWLVLDRPIWVQIAMVGPLTVLPFFVASRLLGTWFETRRRHFGALLVGVGRGQEAAARKSPAPPQEPAPAPAASPRQAAARAGPGPPRTGFAAPAAAARCAALLRGQERAREPFGQGPEVRASRHQRTAPDGRPEGAEQRGARTSSDRGPQPAARPHRSAGSLAHARRRRREGA